MIKYILFLCGGKWQLPWFKFLKNKGHKIILVDPFSDSPCVELADVFYKEDVKNVDSILHFLEVNQFEIEMVTSEQTDVSTIPVSIISEKLGLQCNASDVVRIFSNKGISRNFVKENFNKHYPDFEIIKSVEELSEFIKKNVDVIIKPLDSQSSRGICKLGPNSRLEELKEAFKNCIAFSQENSIIVEKFIFGKEVTLEGICLNNHHYTLTGSDKKHFRTGIASDLIYPLSLNSELKHELFNFHNSLVVKTGLKNAITHAEYIISNDEKTFYLVEFACRGGGSNIPSHIVPIVTNINLYDIFYDSLFNKPNKLNIDELKNSFVTLHFFEFSSGKVKDIIGIEKCKKFNFVIDIGLEFKIGDTLKNASDDRSRQGYVIVNGNSHEEVSLNLKIIYNTILINYEANV